MPRAQQPEKVKLTPGLRAHIEKSLRGVYRVYQRKPDCVEAKNAYQWLSIFLNRTK